LGVTVASLVAILTVRTLLLTSRQIDVPAVEPIEVDSGAAIDRLAQAVRVPTISHEAKADFDPAPFLRFHTLLEQSFPLAHEHLKRERVADYSLLYTWQGSDPKLQPILLMAHIDVVPIEPGTENDWENPPFGGVVSEGFLWGRGSLDDKGSLMAEMEAVEVLLARGFRPQRTIHLAFGHDEEVGGNEGAVGIAKLLAERKVRLLFTLDEGMAILEGSGFGIEIPAAIIAVAEKGSISLKLTARARGGHSSTPPETTSVGTLARAVSKLEASPMPARLSGPAAMMLDSVAPEMGFVPRLFIANRWLFGPLLIRQLESRPGGNALVRTTTAPTILRGGIKENVLPSEAFALVNFRILPGDTIEGVTAHVRRAVDNPELGIEDGGRIRREASPVARVGSPGFRVIHRSIRQIFPETVVVPGLTLGGTDSRHYIGVTDDSYRFVPIRGRPEDLERIHGTNERIAVENYTEIVRFYAQLIRNAAGGDRLTP
jgi:carboxypeptidase PM20D1